MDVAQKASAQPHYYQNNLVRAHKPEGATKDEWYPHREALLYRDRKFLRSLCGHLSGNWQGFILQDSRRSDFTFDLHFHDAAVCSLRISSDNRFVNFYI